jgi:CubicO group peptidase (beta-lactamase class C family)
MSLSRKSLAVLHCWLGTERSHIWAFDVDFGFGLGFSVVRDESDLNEVGSVGRFGWSGFFFTSFFIDPQEQMIGIFMCQLHPSGDLDLGEKIRILSYQAIAD